MTKVGAWGDQGNGTYRNPVLFADYPDPDAIRVGDTYYMTSSEMNYMGMRILSSRDLVNWQMIGSIYDRLPGREYEAMERYGRGSWAPSFRYHNGEFYVYFCTPEEGLFLAKAADPAGKWTLTHIKDIAGWEDPCPYWDKEGQAWLSRSELGAGAIFLHRMSDDGTQLLDEGKVIFRGDGAEGSKWYDHPDGGSSRRAAPPWAGRWRCVAPPWMVPLRQSGSASRAIPGSTARIKARCWIRRTGSGGSCTSPIAAWPGVWCIWSRLPGWMAGPVLARKRTSLIVVSRCGSTGSLRCLSSPSAARPPAMISHPASWDCNGSGTTTRWMIAG